MDILTEMCDLYPKVFFACKTEQVRDSSRRQTLTPKQLVILSNLDAEEPTAVLRLAEKVGVTPATISIALDRLERQQYVRREKTAQDKRIVHVRLTNDGERVKKTHSVLNPDLVLEVLSHLDARQLETAMEGVRVLATAAEEAAKAKTHKTAVLL